MRVGHLDRRVESEVLPPRERLEQRIELRAEPHKAVDFLRVLAHVEAAQKGRARRWRQLPCGKKIKPGRGRCM